MKQNIHQDPEVFDKYVKPTSKTESEWSEKRMENTAYIPIIHPLSM